MDNLFNVGEGTNQTIDDLYSASEATFNISCANEYQQIAKKTVCPRLILRKAPEENQDLTATEILGQTTLSEKTLSAGENTLSFSITKEQFEALQIHKMFEGIPQDELPEYYVMEVRLYDSENNATLDQCDIITDENGFPIVNQESLNNYGLLSYNSYQFGIKRINPEICGGLLGDMSGNGGWNVVDIVRLANCVLAQNCDDPCGDINQDGGYNVLDVVALVNCIMAQNCNQLGVEIPEIEGCTDPNAINYDENATLDDGTCIYDDLGGGS